MNCGLANLETLKRHLLADSLRDGREFDQVITSIGQSVAGLIDAFTNRKLGYLGAAEIVFTGDRRHYVLPRYPLVAVASVESRLSDADEWTKLDDEPWTTHAASGLIRFGGELGDELLQVKVKWAGGYWFETLEPDDDGWPSSAPVGATALPADIQGAWLMQCRAVWAAIDKLGGDILKTGSSSQFVSGSLAGLELIPMVKAMLQGHIRYQLS